MRKVIFERFDLIAECVNQCQTNSPGPNMEMFNDAHISRINVFLTICFGCFGIIKIVQADASVSGVNVSCR